VRQIARSIEAFGFLNPVLVGDGGEVIAGHGCMEAVKLLGLTAAPKIWIGHLNDTERRALLLADNQIALNTSSAPGALQIEFGGLIELGADVQTWPFQVGCRREKSRPHVDT
jgi:ParB-like chromosome segregation protein Spo0J